MNCAIDHQPVEPEEFGYRELNFGQRVDLPTREFELNYSLPEIIKHLAQPYPALVEELKSDLAATGDIEPRCHNELGYPSLTALLQHPDCFCEIVRDFLHRDLFASSFPGPASDPKVRWIINSIDAMHC